MNHIYNHLVANRFHYEIKLNTPNDRKILENLKNSKEESYIGKGVNVIYIYSLVDSYIAYPNSAGKVLYIGEACKISNPTGLRFYQHIASVENGSRGRNINYTLHKYYWNGIKIALDIFVLKPTTTEERKYLERYLINSHIKIYGSFPIAQGTSGILVDDIDKHDEMESKIFFNHIL